jgi:hypothetical protein
MKQVVVGRALSFRLVLALALMVLAAASVVGTAPPVAAQGTATIEINNIDAGSGQPAPFTRFQVTSENGTVYGPLETDLNGYVAFSVTVDPQGTSFTVEEETPPACATAPEPQTTDPLQAGDSTSLSFNTQDNPGCGLGTIALYAMACPDGFSGPADDYSPWQQGCTGTNDGAGFTLTSTATGDSWNPVAGAYGIPGRAPVVGLPAGDYTFQQTGDAPSAVFCLVYDTSNYATSPEPSSVVPVPLTDGAGTISISGNRVSCDVFTVPGGAVVQPAATDTPAVEPVSTGATLDIHLAACPPGYLADDTIYGDCHSNGISGQPVQVSSDNGFAGTIATTLPESPGPGVASFTDLADGTYTVTTNVPADTTVFVYCTDANDLQIPASFDDTSQSLSLALAAGDVITCDWYQLPAAEVQPAQGTASLEIHAALCPGGTDPNGDLYDLCHANGMDGITFTATGPNGYSGQQTTTLPAIPGPGVATFGELEGGSYTVTQQNVDPNSSVSVYCSLADAEDAVPSSQNGTSITLDLPADTGVVCDFYTLPPADQATTLQVTKYSCPVGMGADENTPLSTFQQACTTLTNDVDFTLAPLGQQGSTLTTGSAGEGTLLFEGLPTGNFSLTEDIPGDFNTPFAFCGLEGGQLDPYTWIRGSDPLSIDASAGTYSCLWYNVPADAGQPSSISVTKYLCPEGTTGGYGSRCGDSPLSGATFVLDGPDGYDVDLVTGADGAAWWGELSSGNYTLTEIPPSGVIVAFYVVSCEANGQYFETTYHDRNGMRIELELPAGTDVSCNWYNIPPTTPTVTPNQPQGSITVHKFLCQGKAVSAYNWDVDCAAETVPVSFSLKTSDGRPIAVGSTDANGILKYTGLANGAYTLDETSGDWCHAEADRVDSGGNVLISNGGNTDVYIYNCSLKSVGTLPSTGTGQTGAAPAAGFDEERLWQLALAALATIGIALLLRRGLQQAAIQSTVQSESSTHSGKSDEVIS